jgi:predicted AAA+ superfamily ATPase
MVTVPKLAVVLIGWMCTLTVVEVPLQLLYQLVQLLYQLVQLLYQLVQLLYQLVQLLYQQVRLRQQSVILFLDGLSWDATQIMYPDVRCQR